MSKLKKDGTPDKRSQNRGHASSGRKTKAEEMGLEKRLNRVFEALTKDQDNVDGADVVLLRLRDIALDRKHPKHFDALKWFTDRYFGKEPKAIIIDADVNHNIEEINVKQLLLGAYGNEDQPDIQTSINGE